MRCLEIGTKIRLKSKEGYTEFTVLDVLGVGGGCIAYDVSYMEDADISHRGVLKECCPAFLEKDEAFRRENGSLIVPDGCKSLFEDELKRFKQTYKAITDYLCVNVSASNFHTVQIGLYEGNNTLYTLSSKDYGKSYDKIEDSGLLNIFKFALSATKAVEQYHKFGYVHLDIKPKNILVLDDVTDLVKLFDYDSLTSIADLKERRVSAVPVPEDYYVPELVRGEFRSVGIRTDIFEIGAMIFLRIFKRGCVANDLSYDKEYCFDNIPLFSGASPQAKFEIEVLLRNTLQISLHRRYKTVDELKAQLEKIIQLLDSKAPYLINLPKWQPSAFSVGRQKEISDIKSALDKNGFVFIKAMGGTGKSELTKLFAQKYSSEFHTVQFCKYTDSLKTVVASMPFSGINDSDYAKFDVLLKEKNKHLHLCDENTLIIVDNYNVTHDDFIRDFLPSDNKSFKVIFTTRCTQAAAYYEKNTYHLNNLSFDECRVLFEKHTSRELQKEETAVFENLLETIECNALVLTLIASTVKATNLNLSGIYNAIQEQELENVEAEVFHEYDFDSSEAEVYNKINAHLKTIFSLNALNGIEKEILKNMTLIEPKGIDSQSFTDICDDPERINEESLSRLVDLGWIQNDSGIISLHPIISDLIANDSSIEKENSYYSLADAIEEYCNPDYESHIDIIMDKLAFAIQLEKRYKTESAEKRAATKSKLGRMYLNIYRPDEARKYLKQALEIAENEKVKYFAPYVYYFMGDLEKDFGTLSKAIEYFELSVNTAKNIKIRYYNIALDSMLKIAECYEEDKHQHEAFEKYKEALSFAKTHFFVDYIYEIADKLYKISKDFGWKEKEKKYEKLKKKYEKRAPEQVVIPELENFDEMASNFDMNAMTDSFIRYSARMREELGEDSPLYKDLSKSMWLYLVADGRKEEGMRKLSESLDFIEQTYGEESMEMADFLAMVASSVVYIEDYDYGLQCAHRAIEICRKNNEEKSFICLDANLALVECCFVQGKVKDASKIIDSLDLSSFSGSEYVLNLVRGLGMYLCELSRYDETEELANEVFRQPNATLLDKALANCMLSIVNEQKGDLDLAEKYILESEKLFDGTPEFHSKKLMVSQVYRAKARIANKRFDYRTAINELSVLIEKFSEESTNILLSFVYCERGTYYQQLGNKEKAVADFAFAEKVLEANNMPEERYALLYNNVACFFINNGLFEDAYEYLNKIVKQPSEDFCPENYFDCLVCANIAYVELNMGNPEKAVPLFIKSIKLFEALKCTHTNEYFLMVWNLAESYIKLEDYQNIIDTYNLVYFDFDKYSMQEKDYRRKIICLNYVFSLLKLKQYEEALDFAISECEKFLEIYGSASIIYIDTVAEIGSYFKAFGFDDCADFFCTAKDAVYENGLENTISNAYLQDYIGVYFSDLEEDYKTALIFYKKSKKIFEDLNKTDDEMYQTVLNNIKLAEKMDAETENQE